MPTYRKADPPDDRSLHALEALAAEGEKLKSEHEDSEAVDHRRERELAAMKSASGYLLANLSSTVIVIAVTLLTLGSVCTAVAGKSGMLFVLFGFVTLPFIWLVGTKLRRRALDKELAWAESLPFPYSGHFEWLVLAESYSSEKLCLRVDFRTTPAQELVQNAFAAISPESNVDWADDVTAVFDIPQKQVGTTEHGLKFYVADTYKLHKFMHDVLSPLHHEYSIVRAEWHPADAELNGLIANTQ